MWRTRITRMNTNKNQEVFFELIRSGLWNKAVRLSQYGDIDFTEIYRLAQEQSVVGLLAAGLEKVADVKVPQTLALTIAGEVLQLEQQNREMNKFVASLNKYLRNHEVYCLLVKGQGVAQCYSRPLWRTAGDVDLLLSKENNEKAKRVLIPLSSKVDAEFDYSQHLALFIDGWEVELHGTLRCGLSKRMDRVLDDVQRDTLKAGRVRAWDNEGVDVFMPDYDNDVVFIFTHIIKHFFKGGVGLRQICDWCRLLWIGRDIIDAKLLEERLKKMRMMTEWKAFASLAVEWLGMPSDTMPLYDGAKKWRNKSLRIKDFILETGNFGHNRDFSYYDKYPYLVRKMTSFYQHTSDSIKNMMIFPLDSVRVWRRMIFVGIRFMATRKQ